MVNWKNGEMAKWKIKNDKIANWQNGKQRKMLKW